MAIHHSKVVAVWLGITLLLTPVHAAVTVPALPPGYAVASAHPLATNAGLAILAQGGNAFDAAVAVSAALAVVEPYHSGLGGGGMWLLYQANPGQYVVIDGRETAPAAARSNLFLDSTGKLIPDLSLNGALAAAIPGEPAALAFIAQRYGKLPLATSLAPAIRLAQEGVPVDSQFHYFSTIPDRLAQLQKYPATAAIFLSQGKALTLGDRLVQKDLAATLRALAAQGKEGFYQGPVAKKLVQSVRASGGIWTLDDLAHYRIKVRKPLIGTYHGMQVITAPPPSAGGASLITMLNILSAYPLSTLPKTQWIHYLVEAMRLTFWQRMEIIGDPDFVPVPLPSLLSAENATYLRSLIKPDAATTLLPPSPSSAKPTRGSTTHFSIIDAQGNRVSATLTINYIFGSSLVAAGTGVLLNDEMDDFTAKPGLKNVFGLVGSEKNQIAPGRRPVSSMTPTFLETPDRIAILGTPGGSRIPTMVLLASLLFHDGYGAISMVSAMRFHHQYAPDWLQFEPDTFPKTVQAELTKMGYHLVQLRQYYGDMQAITWDKRNQILTAASDPRHMGLASVVNNATESYGLKY